MNIKGIICSLIIACGVMSAAAQTTTQASHNGATNAHRQAHRVMLANVKSSKMDRSVVNDMIKNDVAKRESELVKAESAEHQQLVADLLKEANRHLGKPYRHGMKGPHAFDCSGFTSYVYKQFGYTISPASRIQYTDGVKVDRKDLRKGDLVFFTSRSSGKNVGHVGIVVSADNETGAFKFIHASIRGIKVSACEGYYANRYVGARRIIND